MKHIQGLITDALIAARKIGMSKEEFDAAVTAAKADSMSWVVMPATTEGESHDR